MIHPSMQLSHEITIHLAGPAAWQQFLYLPDWPRWRPGISSARWVAGEPWQEGACFETAEMGRFGLRPANNVVRMSVPERVAVWESSTPGLTAVYSLQCTPQVGGCKIQLRCTYHGMAVFALRLFRPREQRRLAYILQQFRAFVETPPR